MVAIFVVSRLLYEPVSLGLGSVSIRGDLGQRLAAAVAGERFDATSLEQGMPILDRELLLHDLGRSIWYLHSQPPLFNVLVAAMLRLPGDLARNYQWFNWLAGLVFYLLVFALMLRFGIPEWLAAATTVLFLLLPNAMWLENAVYYGLPIALLLMACVLAFDAAVRRGSARWLFVAAVAAVTIVLTRAFFTPVWCAVVLLIMASSFVRRHGSVVRASAVVVLPFLLVVAFQIKQYALFGQFLGSSWFGCNLTTMTAGMDAERKAALAAGRVSPLVNVYRNDTVEVYSRYFRVPETGVPALDRPRKLTGQPNYNHLVYIPVGRQYLADSLYLISKAPLKYAANVVNSVYIFSGYQIGLYFDYPARFFSRWSWRELGAPFVGFPLIVMAIVHAARRLRHDASNRPLIALMLWNVVYVIAVSCLFEKSEGPVYRQQIEAFLWTFLAARVTAVRLPVFHRRPRLADVRN